MVTIRQVDDFMNGIIIKDKIVFMDNNFFTRIQMLIKQAKKEVFDDLKIWVERDGMTDLEKCDCLDCKRFRIIRNNHLTNNSNKGKEESKND